ncbi:integrating conjugative element protein [Pantoea cypripedii]|uniref:integrating conjugative element protein n=1 Tax=Pantoea cypripedii TaxID=55209 RepID=UPI002FC73BA3
MKYLTVTIFLFLPLFCNAELNVVADLGGVDATHYFEGINKQPELVTDSPELPSFPAYQGLEAMLPVSTPEMTPGYVTDRQLHLPGIGALFLVGDDDQSRIWLEKNADALKSRHAVGMIVNVTRIESVQALRDLIPCIPLAPASGTELARRLNLQHYPVLITDTGLSQQVITNGISSE